MLFSEAARLARNKVRGWKLTLKQNRRSTTDRHAENNSRTSTLLSKAGQRRFPGKINRKVPSNAQVNSRPGISYKAPRQLPGTLL
jgi:hypothetical protein